jgi:putative acetyltransferase
VIQIRSETPSDINQIERVIVAAFKNAEHIDYTEQFIVRQLRDQGALAVSLVAEDRGIVLGHVAISPVAISDGTKEWYGLGPISVLPEHQRSGIGTKLMHQALEDLRVLAASGCVVLGDPHYYSRFGFIAGASLIFPGVPQEYFQAILFKSPMPSGTVSYHEAFSAKA